MQGIKKHILLTGGAGFIGSWLAEALVREGHHVRVLDDFSSGYVNNVRSLYNHRNFKLVRGDIRDKRLVQRAMSGVDVAIHLAAQVHVDRSIINPFHTFEVNAVGTAHVLESAVEGDVGQVIYASSCEVYGTGQSEQINEDHPLNPNSPYAASKAAADRLCYAYYNTFGLNVCICRNFNVFGPRQRSLGYAAVIPIFIRRALSGQPPVIYGDGTQTRDYMYIEDAVKAYRLILEAGESLAGKAVNFGSGKETRILDLAKTISKLCGNEQKPVHVSPRPGEVKRQRADTSFARTQLGFETSYTLEAGLTNLVDWYKRYGYEEWTGYMSQPRP